MMLKYLICFLLYFVVVKAISNDFGEFDLTVTEYINCKGPKRKNCVNSTITLVDNSTVKYHFVVTETLQVIKGKVTNILNGKELMRLQIKDVCDNVFLRPLVQTVFQIEQCSLPKGVFVFSVDLQTIARKFYGGKFMYGNWTTKVLFYTDFCNMHCGIIQTLLTPKTSNDNGDNKK